MMHKNPAELVPPFEDAVKEEVFILNKIYGSKEAYATKEMLFYEGFGCNLGHHNVYEPQPSKSSHGCLVLQAYYSVVRFASS
ncbi:hypothetical protein PsorP6_006594 [Peronosclerospora sorghi]|uniref:Uncharacterized protein n=1 Tax=Peronosclerospora sorghi TaxID=230839 RepID=A0ACC0W734_9STRA|nr:hypothetical protein PsorP6_006594 [Peronosclerospora sorghi]